MTPQHCLAIQQLNKFCCKKRTLKTGVYPRDLEDFIPTGQIEINGVSVDESSLNYLLNQINSDAYQIQSIVVE